jgi:hypothetical protein
MFFEIVFLFFVISIFVFFVFVRVLQICTVFVIQKHFWKMFSFFVFSFSFFVFMSRISGKIKFKPCSCGKSLRIHHWLLWVFPRFRDIASVRIAVASATVQLSGMSPNCVHARRDVRSLLNSSLTNVGMILHGDPPPLKCSTMCHSSVSDVPDSRECPNQTPKTKNRFHN